MSNKNIDTPFVTGLMAGAVAGLSVDLALFPLDTVKTRLQSPESFLKSGGFRGIYSGIGSVLVGSMPGAALFFSTYETVKSTLRPHVHGSSQKMTGVHMMAASTGEIMACLVRVPTEVVKQRAQSTANTSSFKILTMTVHNEGFKGLYRGYTSTVLREIPFSLIQFPLWEYLKLKWTKEGEVLHAWQSSVCGAISGAVAAGITTPLDVAKTRIMIANTNSPLSKGNISQALVIIWKEKGFRGLFAGLTPRVMWITIGGAIFLGIYDEARLLLMK